MGPIIISQQTRCSFLGISAHFIKWDPASVLELVFKSERGPERKSIRFKEDNPIYWNLDMCVYFLRHDSQRLIDSVLQVRSG